MYYDLPPPPLFYHKIVICTIKHFMLIAIVHMKLLHILLLYDSYMVPTGFLEDVERAKKIEQTTMNILYSRTQN